MKKIAVVSLLTIVPFFAQQTKFEIADVHASTTAQGFAQNFGGILREGRYVNRDATMKARAKSEANALRLFYSSLSYDDLQIARRHIVFLSEPFPKPKRASATGTRRVRARKPRA